MRVPIRWRLVLAIGVPLLAVYGGMSWLLVRELRARNLERLEDTAVERVEFLAGRVDDRVRLGGPDSIRGDGLDDLDRTLSDGVGEDVRYVVVDEDGRVVHASWDRATAGRRLADLTRESGRADLASLVGKALSGESGLVRAPGLVSPETRWIVYAPIPSLRGAIFAAAPEAVLLAFSRGQLQLGLALLAGGLVLILAIVAIMATHITRPVSKLARAVSTLGSGNLDARVEGVEANDEIGDLAAAFNRMVADLRRHVDALARETAAREKVEGELRVARKIQNAFLPKSLPSGPAFRMAAKNLAARHVAGDFYDGFAADGECVFLVADVSGKGLPSALFMAASKMVLARALTGSASLADAVRATSESLEKEGVGSMYLTAFVGRYRPSDGTFRYVNAGHPPPWRVTPSGQASPMGEATGGPIGLLAGMDFEEREAVLAPGESLVIFSDGVPEARSSRDDDEFYGDERLKVLLESVASDSAEDLCDRVVKEVETFQAERLADDVTVMVLRREGRGAGKPA